MRKSIKSYTKKLQSEVANNKNITFKERVDTVNELQETLDGESEGGYDTLAKSLGRKIQQDIIRAKVVALLLVLVDSALMLSPAILVYLGYTTASVVSFGLIGVISSITITKQAEVQREEMGNLNRFVVVGIYLVSQAPYLAILIINQI